MEMKIEVAIKSIFVQTYLMTYNKWNWQIIKMRIALS